MIGFGGISHVIKNPAGSYSVVGSVPLAMMAARKPSPADIMAGRVSGGVAYVAKSYASIEEIKAAAAACGAKLCAAPNCSCRSLF